MMLHNLYQYTDKISVGKRSPIYAIYTVLSKRIIGDVKPEEKKGNFPFTNVFKNN